MAISLFVIALIGIQSDAVLHYQHAPRLLGLPNWLFWYAGFQLLLLTGLYLLIFKIRT